jgi:hypothetical protein
MTTGIVDRIAWEPWWRLSMGAGVLDDAGVAVSRGPAGGRSTPVDHAAWPPGSRGPLRTPICENAADLCGEHRAEARVQRRAPRSSAGVCAFALSRLDGAPNLARSARSRSQFFSRRQPTATVGKQKPPRSDPRGLRRFYPEVRVFRALRVQGRRSRACSQRAPSELDERRVGQLSRSLSCPVGREKPRGV